MLEDGVVGMRDEVLEMGLLIRRRRNLVLPTVTCDKSHIVCDSMETMQGLAQSYTQDSQTKSDERTIMQVRNN